MGQLESEPTLLGWVMADLACAQCGSTFEVRLLSPDLDIEPVPLCPVCWWEITSGEKLSR